MIKTASIGLVLYLKANKGTVNAYPADVSKLLLYSSSSWSWLLANVKWVKCCLHITSMLKS